MKKRSIHFAFFFCSLVCAIPVVSGGVRQVEPHAQSIDFYVAPGGNDNNPGSIERPFATWEKAKQAVRNVSKNQPVNVYFREGVYYLTKTLLFGPEDSGTRNAPVTYQAFPGEKVTISGAVRLPRVQWTLWKDGIYRTKISKDIDFDQLFVNGIRQIRARFPNYDFENPLRGGKGYQLVVDGSNRRYDTWLQFDPGIFSKKTWSDPTTGIVHAFQCQNWGNMQYRVKGIDRKENKILLGEGGWQLQRAHGIGKGRGESSPFFVENIFEELDTPGEWFFDKKKRLLYYYPTADVQLASAVVEAVVLKDLIHLSGTADKPVAWINFRGFNFSQTRMTFMEAYEPLARGDWAIHRGGVIFMDGAEDVKVTDCNFEYVGGNGVFMSNYNRRNIVSACRFFHTGESAVCLVGDPNSVRWYATWDDPEIHGRSWNEMRKGMDLAPGPKTNNFPEECVVENSIMYELGDFGKQIAGVFISMSRKIRVSHNTIFNVPRAGICINDGTWGGHIIEHCDIWETVRETGEHGPFNSWGRERFWLGAGGEGQMIREQVLLDAIDPTIIRHNRISNFRRSISAGNWTIDLDDGSSNYEIYNNLSLGSTLKLRDGYFRKVWNNIHVSAVPMGWHVWPANSGDEFYSNITVIAGTVPGANNPTDVFIKPIRMPADAKWGKYIDKNLYYNFNYRDALMCPEVPVAEWRRRGYDQQSFFSDPLFINPAQGDYRVADNSPARKLGFENFPMDQFGHEMTRIIPFGGEFERELVVTLKPDARGGEVYYTLDGSVPTINSSRYEHPIKLKQSARVRVRTFKDGQPVGFEMDAEFTRVEKKAYPSWYEVLLNGGPRKSLSPVSGSKPVLEWWGARLIDIADGDMVDAMGGFESGAFMEEVSKASRAYEAGFRTSDIVVEVNGVAVATIAQLEAILGKESGKKMTFTVIRGYERKTILAHP